MDPLQVAAAVKEASHAKHHVTNQCTVGGGAKPRHNLEQTIDIFFVLQKQKERKEYPNKSEEKVQAILRCEVRHLYFIILTVAAIHL